MATKMLLMFPDSFSSSSRLQSFPRRRQEFNFNFQFSVDPFYVDLNRIDATSKSFQRTKANLALNLIYFYHAQEHLTDCGRSDPSIPLPSAARHHQTNCRSLGAAFRSHDLYLWHICTWWRERRNDLWGTRCARPYDHDVMAPSFRSSECCAEKK